MLLAENRHRCRSLRHINGLRRVRWTGLVLALALARRACNNAVRLLLVLFGLDRRFYG